MEADLCVGMLYPMLLEGFELLGMISARLGRFRVMTVLVHLDKVNLLIQIDCDDTQYLRSGFEG